MQAQKFERMPIARCRPADYERHDEHFAKRGLAMFFARCDRFVVQIDNLDSRYVNHSLYF